MKIFALSKHCPHFRDIDTRETNLYSLDNWVFAHEVSEAKVIEWVKADILRPGSDHITAFVELWMFLNKPMGDFDKWSMHVINAAY